MHLSTCEQLPAYCGRIETLESGSQGMGWWGGGQGHLGFQIQELHDLGKKEFRGSFSVSEEGKELPRVVNNPSALECRRWPCWQEGAHPLNGLA